jgi:hypothetical protein
LSARETKKEREERWKMIKAVMMMNTQGKPRLAKFYDYLPVEKQQELIRGVFSVLCSRPENVSNFLEIESLFGPVMASSLFMLYNHNT